MPASCIVADNKTILQPRAATLRTYALQCDRQDRQNDGCIKKPEGQD